MRSMIAILVLALLVALPCASFARSAFSPRHSGLEPPGGPRQLDTLPGNSPSRTPEGGMGYTDAYGNSLTDRMPEEKKPRHRPRPGAYGGKANISEPLPELPASPGKPLWRFQ